MKHNAKRFLSSVLCVLMLLTAFPATAFAADEPAPDKLELNDGYLKVTVSGKNGGFLIDTVEGDKQDKADDNKNLLYPAEDYDTSYTSFRVTRTNGDVEEYIFGRKYGFLGLATSDVVLSKEGNAIVATWSVKDITVKQSLTLLDETASLHGMVNISYTVSSTADDVANVKMRVMYDTALGFQDYATYEVPNRLNEYMHVDEETVISNSGEDQGDFYGGTLFAVDDPYSPTVTAYTVDAMLDGEPVTPYRLAFGHWNNLASSVFDFQPTGVNFTNPYNQEYMTADSAYALYFDLGDVAKDGEKSFSTYYGIYSNVTMNQEETIAINFPVLPSAMELKEGSTSAYESQVLNGSDGDIHLKLMLENVADEGYDSVTVVIETMNNIFPYGDYLYFPNVKGDEGASLTQVVSDFKSGEEVIIDAYFNVTPLVVSEYRKIKVKCYDTTAGSELTSGRLIGSREFYLFCPGELGETIVFNTIDPTLIYFEGSRNIYLSGLNFGMLKDTTTYTAILRPIGGGEDVVVPATNVVVDTSNGTLNLVVDEQMEVGTYQVILDWVDPTKEDATSDMLRFQVTDDLTKVSPSYGVVTVEKGEGYTDTDPTYKIGLYRTEEAYQKAFTDTERTDRVYLEFRGSFGVRRENGEIVEVRANSLTDVQGKPLSTINISNCLDVECGTVGLLVDNPGEDDQVINIDIDGKVYTTGARTSIWDGVCAITSFENGNLNTMLQYDYEGEVCGDIENTVANTNAITLLWPGAASTAQTIAGMFFEFRYCQFGYMALEKGTVTPDTPKMRVISFGAELSPDFLIPSNFDWGARETSSMEVAQLALAKQNYTADQLRDVQERFARDQQNFIDAQRGSLNLYVTDVLFGGGFAGFNASIEVSLPEYFDLLPSIEGRLDLKVLPANKYRQGRIWEFGVWGSADLIMIQLEASFGMKETPAGAPAIDHFYAYVEGGFPGINIDGVGCFWIIGLGGGVDNIYDSMFVISKAPPLSLIFTASFRIFQILEAKATMEASLRGFSVAMENISIARIDVMDRLSFSAYWYPELKLRADMYLDILGIISGGGYIVIEENQLTNDLFWEAFASASVSIPRIGLIPSIKVGSVDLGVNANKIWGALHVLMLDMGVTYYWGGDVDFAFGKYDSPEPTYPLSNIPVGTDPATGRTLYMNLGSNVRKVSGSDELKIVALDSTGGVAASIDSTADGMSHTIDLGTYDAAKDMLLNVTFLADSEAEAERIVKGNGSSKKGFVLTADGGTATYPLVWLDNSKPADEQTDANASFYYDQETKQASVSISFTESTSYANKWTLKTDASATLTLYEIDKLPGLDSVTYSISGSKLTVDTLTGYGLTSLGKASVYAVDATAADGQSYYLGEVDAADPSATALELPTTLPGGTYNIRVIASVEEENICSAVDSAASFTHVNPLQPVAPTIADLQLGGDYTIDVDLSLSSGTADGYIATVYEKNGNDWIPVDSFTDMIVEANADGTLPATLTLGGSYTTASYVDADGNPTSPDAVGAVKTSVLRSLEAGKTYRVGVAAYNNDDRGMPVYSEETVSTETVVMVAPVKPDVSIKAVGAKSIGAVIDPHSNVIDVVTTNAVSLEITSDMKVSGTWSLDGGAQKGDWSADPDGVIAIPAALTEGEHMITLNGANENGDEFRTQYTFRVDCSAPVLEIASPVSGSFFGGSDNDYLIELVNLEGRSEPGTTIVVKIGGEQAAKTVVDASGSFKIPVALDETCLTQTMSVQATDAAGNESVVKTVTLNNVITGAEGVYLGIFLNGQNVTGKTIPADSKGDVTLRFVAGERSVVIPKDSEIAAQIEWSLMTIEGYLSFKNDYLLTDASAHGMLQATYGLQSASVIVGGTKAEDDLSGSGQGGTGGGTGGNEGHMITFAPGIGFTIKSDDTLPVPTGNDYHFTVEIESGYYATDRFKVTANGTELTAVGGVYTITDVQAPKHIEVSGVEKKVDVPTGGGDDTPKFVMVSVSTGGGYTVKSDDELPLPYGSNYSFTVEIAEGYTATEDFAVVVNGEPLTPVNGVYTVSAIRTPKHVQILGVADVTAPAVTVSMGGKLWKSFLEAISFGLFVNEEQTVTVEAQDAGSGVKETFYYVSNKQLTKEELENVEWTPYTESIKVVPQSQAVVYVKSVDNDGNTVYVSSEGIVMDVEKPEIGGIVDGGTYTGAVTVTATDAAIASITVNGEQVYPAAGAVGSAKQTEFVISPAEGAQTVVITDRAGNSVTYTVTVDKEETSEIIGSETETETLTEKETESETEGSDDEQKEKGSLTWLWITLSAVVVIGIAVALILLKKKKIA